jgi:hypothetical protein
MPGPYPIIIDPPIAPGAITFSAFPTLRDLVEAVAVEVGAYRRTATGTMPIGGEPGRWVMIPELADDEAARATFEDGYLYVESGAQAGKQRRIRREGYEGAWGAVALARVLPLNLVPNVTVILTQPLPMFKNVLTDGFVEIVRRNLARIRVRARIPLIGNGTQTYGLSGYDFITSKDVTDGIYDRRWLRSDGPTARTTAEYDVVTDGATITLATDDVYGTSESFELAALVPADRLLYDGTSWSYVSTGLTDLDGQAAVPIAWLRPLAVVDAFDSVARLLRREQRAGLIAKADADERIAENARLVDERWGPAAQEIIRKRLPRKDPDPPRELVAQTSRRGRRWP